MGRSLQPRSTWPFKCQQCWSWETLSSPNQLYNLKQVISPVMVVTMTVHIYRAILSHATLNASWGPPWFCLPNSLMMEPLWSPTLYWWGNRLTGMKKFAPDVTAHKQHAFRLSSCRFTLDFTLLAPTLSASLRPSPCLPSNRERPWSTRDCISYASSPGILAEAGYTMLEKTAWPWMAQQEENHDWLLMSATCMGQKSSSVCATYSVSLD